MASVFLAEDRRLGRKVAIKRLHSESADETAHRFVREAKVGASLNHPNIVSVYDTVTDDEGVLIVMEYVEGETLRDAIAHGPLEPAAALKILRGVASAIDHAHENGVVHRDVKPANILIGPGGRAKLADLGIASAAERTHITRTGTVLGTAAYIAPERLDGGAGTPAVDVYALAAVAFEALSGRKAMEGSTPVEIASRIVSAPPPDLAGAWPGAPPEAAEVLRRGLAKDPRDRPATASALVDDLGRSLEPVLDRDTRPTAATTPLADEQRESRRPPSPPPVSPGRPEGRPRWLVPALVVAAVVLVLVIVLSAGGGDNDKTFSKRPAAGSSHKQGKSQSTAARAAPAGDPAKTLTAFYDNSVGGSIDDSWPLATDRLHNQVGGYDAFKSSESDVSSFDWKQVTTTSKTASAATVSFADDAHHAAYVDHCTGTAQLVPGGSTGWLVDHLAVQCQRTGGPAPAPPGKADGHDKDGKGKGHKGEGGD
jgi:serine/threonine protein kinase